MSCQQNNELPNITKLFRFLRKSTYTKKMLEEINIIVDNLTDEEIILDGKRHCHPFLHELCQQWSSSFEFLQEIWKRKIFKNFWKNPNYVDKYGQNVLKRLSNCFRDSPGYGSPMYIDRIKWIRDNMRVHPPITDDYPTLLLIRD
jgi:uncharacterized protein (DUF2132 family)